MAEWAKAKRQDPNGSRNRSRDKVPHNDFVFCEYTYMQKQQGRTVWPSSLRRWLQAPVRKGVGSNPTAVTFVAVFASFAQGQKPADI